MKIEREKLARLGDVGDSIVVEVFVDWSGEDPKVVSNTCIFTQGEAPCFGNTLQPCGNKFERCNSGSDKLLCTDELGKLRFVEKERTKLALDTNWDKETNLPNFIKREWAKFDRPSFGQKSYIRQMSVRVDLQTQRSIIDQYRKDQYILKSLLKDWSLKDIDYDLQIKQVSEGANMGFEVIPNTQMKLINQIDGGLGDAFLNGLKRRVEWI